MEAFPDSEIEQALARVAALPAPMEFGDFYQMMLANGFTEAGYLSANKDLDYLEDRPLEVLLDFCEHGLFRRRRFKPKAPGRSLQLVLRELNEAPIADRRYKLALISTFACSFLSVKLFHDPDVTGGTPREAADRFNDQQLNMLLDCEPFGAVPYFVIGDSHSRLYQHPGLLFEHGWSLPVSITCSGGSARGLANEDSRFKYGERLRQFFARIRHSVEQGHKCFFKFGQVDLEYLFNFRWSQEGYPHFDEAKFKEYGAESIRRYIGYLSGLVPPELRRHTYVCSISLPALADSEAKETYIQGIYAFSPRKQEEAERMRPVFDKMQIPSLTTRSRLHLEYNSMLQAAAEAEGFPFANDAVLFLDEKAGKVKEEFTVQGAGKDIHIDRDALTMSVIGPFIERLTAS